MKRESLLSLVAVVALTASSNGAYAAKHDPYATGRFSLSVDGEAAGYLKKVSGGTVKGEVVSHDLGASHYQKKHLATITHEPLTMELDMSMGEPIWDWLKTSLDEGHAMRDITVASFGFSSRPLSRELYDAVITQVKFPGLDASSKEACHMTVIAEARETGLALDAGETHGDFGSYTKKWMCSNFKVEIDGLPADYVSKVSAITVTQAMPADTIGRTRRTVVPSTAQVSNIKLTVDALDFDAWYAWYNKFVIQGKCTDADEKTGSIEFLDPALAAIARVDLRHVGIVSIQPVEGISAEEPARFEVDLYVEQVGFEYFGGK